MRTHPGNAKGRDGVALIIVLGLLAVLTILAVAFAIAMRVEWWAARHNANAIRARQLVHVGLARAMNDINLSMAGKVYPCWTNRPAKRWDAMGSDTASGPQATDLVTGEAARGIPADLIPDAAYVATNYCFWTNIYTAEGKIQGRVAYVAVNASGCVDPNYASGALRDVSTNLNEIDVSMLLKPGKTTADFAAKRDSHRRYETLSELAKINNTVKDPPEGFFPFSLDVGRDVYFPTNNAIMTIGTATAILTNKFDINAISKIDPATGKHKYPGYDRFWDYDGYKSDPAFMSEYYAPLLKLLSTPRLFPLPGVKTLVERPPDVSWNLINWLDPDRIPQGGMDFPWRHTEGGEALPLFNEIVFRPCAPPAGSPPAASNFYETVVELWYPFVPTNVEASDNFSLTIGVFLTNWHGASPDSPPNPTNVMSYAYSNFSFSVPITHMEFGTPTEFLVVTSPPDRKISFQVVDTNTGAIVYLPVGAIAPSGTVWKTPISPYWNKAQVCFLGRVYKTDTDPSTGIVYVNPVDEAMGYAMGMAPDDETGEKNEAPLADFPYYTKRSLMIFDRPRGYSVADPRSNGQVKYWTSHGKSTTAAPKGIGGIDYAPGGPEETLGTTNVNCNPWYHKGQGTPIYGKNGPMRNIAELGYIFRSNIEDEMDGVGGGYSWKDGWWRTIDLMSFDEGAALLDWCTIRPTNAATRGLVCLSSRQTNSLFSIFDKALLGYSGTEFIPRSVDISNLVSSLISQGPYICWRDMFTTNDSFAGGGGIVADAMRALATNATAPEAFKRNVKWTDIAKEDALRSICELTTFRQNIFQIIIAAEVFAADGQTVTGRKRALVTVYRDSYTGKYVVRSMKWLTKA